MIVLHIIAALLCLGLATINYFLPTNRRLTISYSLAAVTLASGISLIFLNNASVLRTCLTGVLFFAVVSALNELARKKLSLNQCNPTNTAVKRHF